MKDNFDTLDGDKLKETDGITIPWKDNMFDKAICYGVFDACDQEKTLAELMRVLKQGGQLYITGKNYNYCDDDNEAYVAEVNARKKGHPNSFTNLKEMISQLQNQGAIIRQKFLFERRGDAVNDRVADICLEDKFYEWQIIVEKAADNMFVFEKFSDLYSDTFRNKVCH